MHAARNATTHDGPDPRLSRSLWQALCLGALALAVLPSLRAGGLPIGSGAWLLVAPLVALAALHRNALRAAWRGGLRGDAPGRASRRPAGDLSTARAAPASRRAAFGLHAARASVPGSTSGARHASHDPVPGVRVAAGKRRSPRHDTRSLPVAGRRHR
jgi:hypothetical protein